MDCFWVILYWALNSVFDLETAANLSVSSGDPIWAMFWNGKLLVACSVVYLAVMAKRLLVYWRLRA